MTSLFHLTKMAVLLSTGKERLVLVALSMFVSIMGGATFLTLGPETVRSLRGTPSGLMVNAMITGVPFALMLWRRSHMFRDLLIGNRVWRLYWLIMTSLAAIGIYTLLRSL